MPCGPRSAALGVAVREYWPATHAATLCAPTLQPCVSKLQPYVSRWSLVWGLASSSASSLADAQNSSAAEIAGEISISLPDARARRLG